jgi:hypothetical protein
MVCEFVFRFGARYAARQGIERHLDWIFKTAYFGNTVFFRYVKAWLNMEQFGKL